MNGMTGEISEPTGQRTLSFTAATTT